MIRPTAEQAALLTGFQRLAFAWCDAWNRNALLKRLGHAFLRSVGARWVYYCTRRLLHVEGAEHLAGLAPDRGVVIAANHRSFFDLYVVASVLLRSTSWVKRMYFPVRSNYWYERPDAILANGLMSAWAMYPPVLRDPKKRAFNQYVVDYLKEAIQQSGTVVGLHPEGTRNKTDDPYTLLPSQPGIGEIIRVAQPVVLPVFVLGLGNDLPRQVRGNFDGRGEPITMVFGRPLDLRAHFEQPPRLRTYVQIASVVRAEIMKLGQQERELRARKGLPSKGPDAAAQRAACSIAS